MHLEISFTSSCLPLLVMALNIFSLFFCFGCNSPSDFWFLPMVCLWLWSWYNKQANTDCSVFTLTLLSLWWLSFDPHVSYVLLYSHALLCVCRLSILFTVTSEGMSRSRVGDCGLPVQCKVNRLTDGQSQQHSADKRIELLEAVVSLAFRCAETLLQTMKTKGVSGNVQRLAQSSCSQQVLLFNCSSICFQR